MKASETKTFAEKIISHIYDPRKKWKYDIWQLKLVVLFFIVFNFHQVNKYPVLRLDYITIAEVLFLIYTLLFFIFFRNKLSFKVQIMSLFLDFLFIAFFDYQSLSVFGYSSRVYVLYIIPVIYCSYWFRGIFTTVFVTLVSAVYAVLNFYTPDMKVFYRSEERILKLWPVIGVFYLIALGIILYKRYVVYVYPELKKRAEKSAQIKESTRNVLKDKIDGYIELDEIGNVVDTNKLAWELLGYSEKEIREINVKELYSPGQASKIMKLLKDNPDDAIYNIRSSMQSKENEKIPILVSASFLYDRKFNLKEQLTKGKKFPSIGYFRDVRAEDIFENVTRDITQITNERELLDKIVKKVAETIKSEACNVFIYNDSSGRIEEISGFGVPEQHKGEKGIESYAENEGVTGKVFPLGKTLNISNIDVKNRQPGNVGIKWKYANRFAKHSRFGDLKHFLGTPLIFQGEVYGVIRVLNKYRSENESDTRGFTDRDQWLLERISNQVSILLEKVRNKERFEALSKVGMELNERLELSFEELLEVIVTQVVIGMKFKACYLRLIEAGNELRIKTCHGLKGKYKDEKYTLKIGEGISGKVAATGGKQIIEDIESEKNYKLKELWRKEELKSMLSVPLKYRGRVIGVINCYTGRKHKFTEQEIQIMETFAVYAAVAIQNKKRIDELMALNEIGREVSKPFQTEELLDIILQKAKVISNADRLCIKRYNERTGEISTIRSLNCVWHNQNRNFNFKLGEDKISKVVDTGEPIIIKNFDAEKEGLKNEPSKELLKKFKSRIIVPIKIYGKIFGALCLESHRKNFFTEDDLLISNTFSIQAANAIRNADFFKKLQSVTETFPKISELHINIDEVIKKIADTAAKVLETDILVLYRYDVKSKKIIWPPITSGELFYPRYM
jgi:PAS domain S-box-containing protein